MTLKLYNTLTRKKEEFKPLKKGKVSMYSCGPTVYNYAHIGNLRSFTFADILKRYLKYKGFKVTHVMNITDVDDKTIKNSRAQKETLRDFTDAYTIEFLDDFDTLKIKEPDIIPRATETIPEMVAIIKKLLDKGVAYKGDDGSVYYNITKFPGYGKLSHTKLEGLKSGVRVTHDEYDKENLSDFALWKAWDEDDGNVFWETELGKGRPGWHIECSAMSSKYLGNTFDIHTGGVDLIFPHHENEIAQSEAANGKDFVKYWSHCEHLIVDGRKMSKSLGNFYTLRDLLDKGMHPMAIRYDLLSTHYKQQLNFTLDSVKAAESSLERINNFISDMIELSLSNSGEKDPIVIDIIDEAKRTFEDAMDDDLNISGGLAAIFEFIRKINSMEGPISSDDAEDVLETMEGFDTVLGVMNWIKEESIEKDLQELIDQREEARKAKDWATADRLRDELKEKGIILSDGKDGVKWKRA